MPSSKVKPQCKDAKCQEFFPGKIEGIFVSLAELKAHGWIDVGGDIYCPKCAIWNLGLRLGQLEE